MRTCAARATSTEVKNMTEHLTTQLRQLNLSGMAAALHSQQEQPGPMLNWVLPIDWHC